MFVKISAVVLVALVAASYADQSQTWYNSKIDSIILKYKILVGKEQMKTPIKVIPDYVFSSTNSPLYGTQNMSGLSVKGIEDLKRYGNITGRQTGEYSWELSGTLNLSAPLITGKAELSMRDGTKQNIVVLATPVTDLQFSFTLNVNSKWEQLIISRFEYSYVSSSVKFPVRLACDLQYDMACNNVQSMIETYMTQNAGKSILAVVKRILSNVPFVFA